MPNEIELKLELAPDATERLAADPPWSKASGRRSERQLSIYYDTPDLALRKCGYALRVRSIGDRFVQTLKSLDIGAGLFDRGEWEWAIDGAAPDLARLKDTPVAALEIGELEPVVRSEVDRTIFRVDQGGSELELDLDLGIIGAAAREMPVSEFELELIDGEPRAAVELAQRIAAEVPVKLAVMSKAERGFALAEGRLAEPMKAEPVKLRPDMIVAEGLETIVSACLRHFRLNEPLVLESRHVEGLHQARVAMRRLRSAFSLFKPVTAGDERNRLQDELRWFTAELGDARNLDVYLERELTEDQRRFVGERREQAYDNAIAAIDSARLRRLMLDLVGWAAAGQWREGAGAAKPLEPYLNGRIDRLWSKIRDTRKVANLSDERRHQLRIRMKKLRYGLEFADALHTRKPRRKKKFEKTVKALQNSLGDLHDIVTARSLVALNSWLQAPGPSAKDQRRLVRDGDRAIKRLRKVGRYWG